MTHDHGPPTVTERSEAKLLALARSQLADGKAIVARQHKLLDEARQMGLRTVEIEASLTRLQAIVDERRAALDAILSKQADTQEV